MNELNEPLLKNKEDFSTIQSFEEVTNKTITILFKET